MISYIEKFSTMRKGLLITPFKVVKHHHRTYCNRRWTRRFGEGFHFFFSFFNFLAIFKDNPFPSSYRGPKTACINSLTSHIAALRPPVHSLFVSVCLRLIQLPNYNCLVVPYNVLSRFALNTNLTHCI